MTIELIGNLWTWLSLNFDTYHWRSWAGTNSFATGAVIGRSSALVLMSQWSIMKCLNIWYSWVGNSNLVLEVEEAVQVVGQQMRMRQDDKEAPTWKNLGLKNLVCRYQGILDGSSRFANLNWNLPQLSHCCGLWTSDELLVNVNCNVADQI